MLLITCADVLAPAARLAAELTSVWLGALPVIEKTEPSGTHGHDPSIPDLHATFVACGAGIKPGTNLGEIRNTDVAPTIAALLDLEMRDTDGHALTAALAR